MKMHGERKPPKAARGGPVDAQMQSPASGGPGRDPFMRLVNPADIEERIAVIAEPILLSLGLELVAVEYLTESGSRILRIYIDKPGGVAVDDCADVSHELSAVLDVDDPIPQRYSLEVSSPGLDRPLVKEGDYVRFAGKKANIRTKEALEGRRNFKVTIEGAAGGVVIVKDSEGRRIELEIANIDRARLEAEI